MLCPCRKICLFKRSLGMKMDFLRVLGYGETTDGVAQMGRAFVSTGKISAYIGCRVYPNGDDMLVFLVNFLLQHITKETLRARCLAEGDGGH